MKHLKSDQEFAQEVIRRSEVYKKKRKKAITSAACSFVILFVCGAFWATYSGMADSKSSDDMLISGQGIAAEEYSDKAANDISNGAIDINIDMGMQNVTESNAIFSAEITKSEQGVESFAGVTSQEAIADISLLIADAKTTASDSAPAEGVPAVAQEVYRIVITESADVYYLSGSELYDESENMVYRLSQGYADELRENLELIMNGE